MCFVAGELMFEFRSEKNNQLRNENGQFSDNFKSIYHMQSQNG